MTPERLAEIKEWLSLPVIAIEGNPYYAKDALADLLNYAAKLQQENTAKQARICELTRTLEGQAPGYTNL
jgi:hypothetical protein